MGVEYFNLIKDWVKASSKEELKEFFSSFTKDDIESNLELFYCINRSSFELYPDDFVYLFFYYRNKTIEIINDNSAIEGYLKELIVKNEKVWKDYQGGKDGASGRFIGPLIGQYKVPADKAKEVVERFRLL